LGVADGKWTAKAHRPLVTQIQCAWASLRQLTAVLLLWVPGHADVEGNEAADRLAKGAAQEAVMGTARAAPPGPVPAPPLPLHLPLHTPPTHPPPPQDPDTPHSPRPTGGTLRRSMRVRMPTYKPARVLFPGLVFSATPPSRKRTRPQLEDSARRSIWQPFLADIHSYIYPVNWPPLLACIHGCVPTDRISRPNCPLCVEAVRRYVTLPESSHMELPDLPWPEAYP
jgi:hypothetical protein